MDFDFAKIWDIIDKFLRALWAKVNELLGKAEEE